MERGPDRRRRRHKGRNWPGRSVHKEKTVNGHLETPRLKPRAGDDKMFAQEFNMAAVIAGANNEGGKEGTGEAKDSEVAAGTDSAKAA